LDVNQFINQNLMTMAQFKTNDFPVGKKIFARYADEYNDLQINFIPTYVLNENGIILIGTKNNMVGTPKGYYQLDELTGKNQINANYLSNIHIKKKD
jgi:hypothetical protein